MRCTDCFEVFTHPSKTSRKTRLCGICRGVATKLRRREPSERTAGNTEKKFKKPILYTGADTA